MIPAHDPILKNKTLFHEAVSQFHDAVKFGRLELLGEAFSQKDADSGLWVLRRTVFLDRKHAGAVQLSDGLPEDLEADLVSLSRVSSTIAGEVSFLIEESRVVLTKVRDEKSNLVSRSVRTAVRAYAFEKAARKAYQEVVDSNRSEHTIALQSSETGITWLSVAHIALSRQSLAAEDVDSTPAPVVKTEVLTAPVSSLTTESFAERMRLKRKGGGQ
jgi:hypothetical protein